MRSDSLVVAVLLVGLLSCTPSSSLSCEDVGPEMLAALSRGFTPAFPALTEAQAVESRDFDETWFVAAEVAGAGIGVWATDADPTGSDLTEVQFFSVNGVAHQASDWPDHPDPELSMDSDGAAEAESCVAD